MKFKIIATVLLLLVCSLSFVFLTKDEAGGANGPSAEGGIQSSAPAADNEFKNFKIN